MTDKSYPPLAEIIYSRFTYPWRFTRVPSVYIIILKLVEVSTQLHLFIMSKSLQGATILIVQDILWN